MGGLRNSCVLGSVLRRHPTEQRRKTTRPTETVGGGWDVVVGALVRVASSKATAVRRIDLAALENAGVGGGGKVEIDGDGIDPALRPRKDPAELCFRERTVNVAALTTHPLWSSLLQSFHLLGYSQVGLRTTILYDRSERTRAHVTAHEKSVVFLGFPSNKSRFEHALCGLDDDDTPYRPRPHASHQLCETHDERRRLCKNRVRTMSS